jgi:hypothetical protein
MKPSLKLSLRNLKDGEALKENKKGSVNLDLKTLVVNKEEDKLWLRKEK